MAVLKSNSQSVIDIINDLQPIEKIKFDLFFSDFIYKYYLDSNIDNYLELYTNNLRKILGITQLEKNKNIKDQIKEDMGVINPDLKQYLNFKEKVVQQKNQFKI